MVAIGAAAWPRGSFLAADTTAFAPGWLPRYWVADPVTELTVLATPLGLQAGAADAVGAAITVAARPASRP